MKMEIGKKFFYVKWVCKNLKGFFLEIFVLLMLEVIGALSSVFIALTSKNLVDNAINGKLNVSFFFGGVFVLLVLIGLGTNVASSLISIRTSEALSNNIRQRLFSVISKSEWLQVTSYHSGDLLTRLTSDATTISSTLINVFPTIVSLGTRFIAAFFTLLYLEPYLAVVALLMGPVTVIGSRLWGRKLKKLQKSVQESEGKYRSYIQEALQNIMIVKVFGLENFSNDKIKALHLDRMKCIKKRNNVSVAAGTVMGLGYWTGYILAFMWGAVRLSQKATSFGTLTAFLQLVEQIQGPFIGLSRTIPQLISMTASIERLNEIENFKDEESEEKIEIENGNIGITFNNLIFSYDSKSNVFENINLTIEAKKTIGIIGGSGQGKTTLIRLLLGLVKPAKGYIKLTYKDGNAINVTPSTRRLFSYVPQGNTLISGSVFENIKCGNVNATFQEVMEAAEMACVDEFIFELDGAYDTYIGEKGIGLSEGQAQRISIARALLRKSPILILDEATSSLDMELENRILENIKNTLNNITCIIITHRLATLKICDSVVQIKNGTLVEASVKDVFIEKSLTA